METASEARTERAPISAVEERERAKPAAIQDDRLGVPVPDRGDHHRRGVGELRLGDVLVLGPQGDLVADRLARVRGIPSCPDHPRLARQSRRDPVDRGVRGDGLLLPGRELGSVRPPQLRKLKSSTTNPCHNDLHHW